MKKINNEYDIGEAFAAIENEIIASMMRNISRHKAQEEKEGREWSMWQAEQLKALEKFKSRIRRSIRSSSMLSTERLRS